MHCVACNKPIVYYEQYCDECQEEISHVYEEDTAYMSWMKGIHPYKIPLNFHHVNFGDPLYFG